MLEDRKHKVPVKMSIKSQKSLNDECSEIIEKSYSVRSASEESLSCRFAYFLFIYTFRKP